MISVGALALYIHILGNNRAIEGGRVLVDEDLSIRGVDDTLEFAVATYFQLPSTEIGNHIWTITALVILAAIGVFDYELRRTSVFNDYIYRLL